MTAPASRLVVNTSALIHLAEAGLLDLLRDAAPIVWIPEPVAREIRAYGPRDRPHGHSRPTTGWKFNRFRHSRPRCRHGTWVELARSVADSTAVIDDLAGRRCAEALGLALRGTVGLVLAAKQAGRLRFARPVLERLRDNGMYLSDAVLQRALRFVAE